MKRLLSIMLALFILVFSVFTATAATGDVSETGKTVVDYGDWIIEKINKDTQWELDEYKGTAVEIDAPRIIGDMLVVSFGDHCFANNSTLRSVVTSSPLWTVGEYAFIDCTALESFECNYAMSTIGVGAFSGTSSLKSINLEDSIVTEISPYTFLNSGIEEIRLPETCTKIGLFGFGQCALLSKITIPDSVTEIHDDAFSGCDALTIYCYTDSCAHEYAVEKEIPFVLLDAPVEYTFILGDADGDGIVTIMDATRIQRVLADLVEDTDGLIALRAANGEALSIMHATRVQRWLVDYEVSAPIGTTVTSLIPYYLIF